MAEQTAIVNGQIVYIEEGGTAKPIMLPDGQILFVPAAAGGGFTAYPYGHQHLDRQFAGMAAAKLGGVLQ